MIKLSIALAQGQWEKVPVYVLPITAFMIGVFLSLAVQEVMGKRKTVYSRRAVLGIEIICMLVISFLPQNKVGNITANTLVSFLCAMQMQTFQIFRRQGIATTVATGNLRKAVECLYHGICDHDAKQLQLSANFFVVISLFIIGVISGTIISEYMGVHSILVPMMLLIVTIGHITRVYHKVHADEYI